MEQNTNQMTDRERQLEAIAQAVRETEYPPLNGGPTIQDLAGLLKGAAATIEKLGDLVDDLEYNGERRDELQDAINVAVDKLEDIDIDLTLAQASGELGESKALKAIQDVIMEVRSNLRGA